MSPEELKLRNIENEFVYSTSRSSGPGGQNVNKVSTKVELRFSLRLTSQFSDPEKEILFKMLKNKINSEGELILVSQVERTQTANKNMVTEKFYDLVSKALTLPIKRKSTRPTLTSRIKRLDKKRIHGSEKKLRKDTGKSAED